MTARWLTLVGSLIAAIGLLMMVLPFATALDFTLAGAWMLLAASAFQLAIAWPFRATRATIWQVLLSMVYAAIGLYLMGRGSATPETIRPAVTIGLLAAAALETAVFLHAAGYARRQLFLIAAGIAVASAGMIWLAGPRGVVATAGLSVLFSGIARATVTMASPPELRM